MNDDCIAYMTELCGREVDPDQLLASQIVDSLALLDWLFYVEEKHGFAIPAEFIEAVRMDAVSVRSLHESLIDGSVRFERLP